jgi:WD40 repeat protein
LWDLTAKDLAASPIVLRGHEKAVNVVAISPNSRRLVTGSQDGTARLWDLSAKDPAANSIILRHEQGVTAVAISPDNRWLVTGSEEGTAQLWDLSAKDPAASSIVLLDHAAGPVEAVAISPDNRWVLTGSANIGARLWLLQSNDLVNLARITAGRNFSINEWKRYFPGEKYRRTFDELPPLRQNVNSNLQVSSKSGPSGK